MKLYKCKFSSLLPTTWHEQLPLKMRNAKVSDQIVSLQNIAE